MFNHSNLRRCTRASGGAWEKAFGRQGATGAVQGSRHSSTVSLIIRAYKKEIGRITGLPVDI